MGFEKIHEKLEFDAERCKQCLLCVMFCPVKALTLDGLRIRCNEKCIGCGTCEKYCPDLAIRAIKPSLQKRPEQDKTKESIIK
ncbi:MAG: 4Fe-4S binding protein [Candidatus Woesearchaeota archaeon]